MSSYGWLWKVWEKYENTTGVWNNRIGLGSRNIVSALVEYHLLIFICSLLQQMGHKSSWNSQVKASCQFQSNSIPYTNYVHQYVHRGNPKPFWTNFGSETQRTRRILPSPDAGVSNGVSSARFGCWIFTSRRPKSVAREMRRWIVFIRQSAFSRLSPQLRCNQTITVQTKVTKILWEWDKPVREYLCEQLEGLWTIYKYLRTVVMKRSELPAIPMPLSLNSARLGPDW